MYPSQIVTGFLRISETPTPRAPNSPNWSVLPTFSLIHTISDLKPGVENQCESMRMDWSVLVSACLGLAWNCQKPRAPSDCVFPEHSKLSCISYLLLRNKLLQRFVA